MAKIGVSLKIDVTKIDKARLFAGQKGKYLDATIFVDLAELDQYGNSGMITQDVSKEEKQQGVNGNILGNGKVFWVENGQAPQAQGTRENYKAPPPRQQAPQGYQQQAPRQQPPQQAGYARQQAPTVDFDDDLPF